MITGKVIDETSKLEEMIRRYNHAVDIIRRSEIENEKEIKKRKEKEKELREKALKEQTDSEKLIDKIKSSVNTNPAGQ